jgi:hypothetical protein
VIDAWVIDLVEDPVDLPPLIRHAIE